MCVEFFSNFLLIYGTGGVEGANAYCYIMTSRRHLNLTGLGVLDVGDEYEWLTCLLFAYTCNISISIATRPPVRDHGHWPPPLSSPQRSDVQKKSKHDTQH
jgi:hypothetical protein